MKRWIASLLMLILALACFGATSANTVRLDSQLSEVELTKKFNDILDGALMGDNVCVTPSAARKLDAMMADSASNLVREKAFARVPEAEKNIRVFAKALLAAGAKESGATRITPETIKDLFSDLPEHSGGPTGGRTGVGDLLCPLFPHLLVEENLMDVSLVGFQSANELAKQLITLATGLLALSITFTKDAFKSSYLMVTWPLKLAWIAWLSSVCCGIWTMMALTGMIFRITQNADAKAVTYGTSVSIPALLQILTFVLGIALLIFHGARMLRLRPETSLQSENAQK